MVSKWSEQMEIWTSLCLTELVSGYDAMALRLETTPILYLLTSISYFKMFVKVHSKDAKYFEK